MLNLFDYLTPLDNQRIENYIYTYGASKSRYIGNKEYLKYWAKCKPRLFHLLGGTLIYRTPVLLEKESSQIRNEINDLIVNSFFFSEYAHHIEEGAKTLFTDPSLRRSLRSLTYFDTFHKDKIPFPIKIKIEGQKKTLQLQAGMKPVRALQKIINYFNWEDLQQPLEEFRIAHSMILNDKMLRGTLCLSIHPLDFLTMSDNSSGWSSCMSWKKKGCYQLGSVEMMNSNNVICCYLESASPYSFNENKTTEEWTWNSKKWRQLFYVTKEIAVCGKAYPYQNKSLSLLILDKIKELTEKNLNRTYTYGPEPYRDMIHIGSNFRMQQNRFWIFTKDTSKHNILFDTKGMYNDMFNDHEALEEDLYWCYRNKVKHNIIISYSGKAPCLCCGGKILKEGDLDLNYEGAYNDRYRDAGQILCSSCRALTRCSHCKKESGTQELFEINGQRLCKDCVNNFLKKCPSCKKSFFLEKKSNQLYLRISEEELYQQDFYPQRESEKNSTKKIVPLFMCDSCRNKEQGNFKKVTPPRDPDRLFYSWRAMETYLVSKKVSPPSNSRWSRYFRKNLTPIDKAGKALP